MVKYSLKVYIVHAFPLPSWNGSMIIWSLTYMSVLLHRTHMHTLALYLCIQCRKIREGLGMGLHKHSFMHTLLHTHSRTYMYSLTSYPSWFSARCFLPECPASAVQAASPADASAAGPWTTTAQGAAETAWTTTKGNDHYHNNEHVIFWLKRERERESCLVITYMYMYVGSGSGHWPMTLPNLNLACIQFT